MGLVSKLKNILFEEEEVEIPIIEKKEKKQPEMIRDYEELPKKEEVKVTNYQNLEPIIREEKKMEDSVRFNSGNETVSEREIFKSEKTFNFPAFDEEEFEHFVPKKRATNVIEHERKKQEKKQEYKSDYRKDYKSYEETKETKKFKPSPIISPVYGILDKNYTPDEITTRINTPAVGSIDVDTVRKKAFGTLEKPKTEKVDIQEEIIVNKALEEKLEKARTIDELLKDSSDEVIDIDENIDKEDPELFSSVDQLDDVLDEPSVDTAHNYKTSLEDDTLENDLFDLIDSMYENREEDK